MNTSIRPADGPSDGLFYTNRCTSCGRATTKLEILKRMQNPKPLCPCGSNSFKSTNFRLWEELLLPRSWRMWLAIRRGELPPPPTADEVKNNRNSAIAQVASLSPEEIDEPEVTNTGFGVIK